MVKPTDELPEEPAKKKRKPRTKKIIPPLTDSSDQVTPADVPKVEDNPPLELNEPSLILSTDGQDPIELARQINEGMPSDGAILDQHDEDNLLQQMAGVFVLWWEWAYFEIRVVKPNFPVYQPAKMIPPAAIPGSSEFEFVYSICDHGNKMSASKGAEMFSVGLSMCKLFYTIEKMIFMLVKRLQDEGIDGGTEVQVTFEGHLLAQRKAFESIINLNYNVVVTNFDPGTWGERYLEIVKRLADRGYGYPSEAPRDVYKLSKRGPAPVKR